MENESDRPECTTFEQYVVSLFRARKTDSNEFKTMLNIYGREKILKIWEKFKADKEKNTLILR